MCLKYMISIMLKNKYLNTVVFFGIGFFVVAPFLQMTYADSIFKGVLGGGGGTPGCTDPAASNFNPLATINDGSCVYPPPPCVGSCVGGGGVFGCMDPKATNYNQWATQSDGSCVYPSISSTSTPATTTPPVVLPPVTPITPVTPVTPPTDYVPTACQPYITSNIGFGRKNNPEDVRRLQIFLNRVQKEGLITDGEYKIEDVNAVKRFQSNNPEVLRFWDLNKPTGSVFITTRKKINTLQCEYETGIKCPFFTQYQIKGDVSPEVLRIKKFLNALEGEDLALSEVFDTETDKAVKRFQARYTPRVLVPWGLPRSTGWWYQSTKKTANDLLGCFEPVRLDNGVVIE